MAIAQPNTASEPLVREDQAFRAYHEFLRSCRQYMDASLVSNLDDEFESANPDADRGAMKTSEALEKLGPLPSFQLYGYLFRRLQQFKYHWPELGLCAFTDAQRGAIEAELAESATHDGEYLRLDPNLELPDYYEMVDFHQHPGGVATDTLDGVVYELGRRTTVPQHADPNSIYHILFDSIPDVDKARKVLDWGTGHGAGIVEFRKRFTEAECHGVDLSAPCLMLAHHRALEAGVPVWLSQQDVEHLDYPDDMFDLVFAQFMFHEIPPKRYPEIFKEACRVIEPGGLFVSLEFHVDPDDAVHRAMQVSHSWLNNETYASSWFAAPIEDIAREAGFSNVTITPSSILSGRRDRSGKRAGLACWNLYVFEK